MTFKRPSYNVPNENSGGTVAQKDDIVPQNVSQNADNVPQKRGYVLESVPQNSKEMLQGSIREYISHNSSILRDEIATKLNISSKTVGRYLAKMGVYWEGHPKTGYWIIPNLRREDYDR